MCVSISRLRVDADAADGLVAAFRRRARFVDLQVLQSDRDPTDVLMVSRWQDRMSFASYKRSDAHRAPHGRIERDLKAAVRPERLEHLHAIPAVVAVEHPEYRAVAE